MRSKDVHKQLARTSLITLGYSSLSCEGFLDGYRHKRAPFNLGSFFLLSFLIKNLFKG